MTEIIAQIPWWIWLPLAVVVAIVGAARVTRLVVHDTYPPIVRLRVWWADITDDGPWNTLLNCPWCFGPWAFLAAILSFLLTFEAEWIAWAWWLFWPWMAGSYLVSQYVYFDEGNSSE